MDSAFISNCGFRLIDGYGHCKRLQVFDDVQINEFLRNADLSALSPASRTKLERRELIPQRITDGGTLTENQLLTPTVIDGARRWYCALYNDGSLSDGSLSAISYQQFLKTFHSFDEQVYVGS